MITTTLVAIKIVVACDRLLAVLVSCERIIPIIACGRMRHATERKVDKRSGEIWPIQNWIWAAGLLLGCSDWLANHTTAENLTAASAATSPLLQLARIDM